MKHILPYLIAVAAVCLAAFAQILLKKSASLSHRSHLTEYLNWRVLTGYGLMGISLLINVYAMRIGLQIKELSIIECLSYMIVPALSFLFFKERISWRQGVAIAVILIGAVVFFL